MLNDAMLWRSFGRNTINLHQHAVMECRVRMLTRYLMTFLGARLSA